MTDEMKALARRVVACAGWRWMPGMRTRINVRPGDEQHAIVCHYDGNGALVLADERGSDHGWYRMAPGVVRGAVLPDLADPATIGCLLHLVREAWGEPDTCVVHSGGYDGLDWWVPCAGRSECIRTEAEALVVALENAHQTEGGES